MKFTGPNNLGLADQWRDIHFGLQDRRLKGEDITLGAAIRAGFKAPNGRTLKLSDLKVETEAEAIDLILADLGINKQKTKLSDIVSLPETHNWIVPEIFLTAIEHGMRQDNAFYRSVVAETVSANSDEIKQPSIGFPSIEEQGMREGGRATTPAVGGLVEFSSRSVRATKFERTLNVPWEVQQFATLSQLQIFLTRLGKMWGLQLTRSAIDVLINGDAIDGSLAAGVVGVENTTNKLQWIDLIRVLTRFGRLGFMPTTVITTEAGAIHALNLDEFKNRQDGSALGQINIQGRLPTSWDYFMHSTVGADKFIFLDPAFALRQITVAGLRIESTRNAALDLTSTFVRMHHAYANIERQARVIVDQSIAYSGNQFPSWMAPID